MLKNCKAFGDFARAVAVRSARTSNLRDAEVAPEYLVMKAAPQRVEKSAMQESSGVTGGYLVPPEFRLDVESLLAQYSPFFDRERCYVQDMTTEQMYLPGVDVAAGNASGTSSLYGGINPVVTQEAATLPESEPSFVGPTLVARNVEAYAIASNQLVWDGGQALGDYLTRMLELSLLWKASYYFCQGNGADQPLGLVNAPASALVTRAGGGTVAVADIANMMGSLIPACVARSIWLVNPSAFKKIAQIASFVANNWNYKEGSACGFLYTRPVFLTDQLPAVGTKGDVVLFDPRMYAVGVRSMEIAASDVPKFTTNQTVFRFILRCDGQPLARNTVTMADGATTGGVSVVLN